MNTILITKRSGKTPLVLIQSHIHSLLVAVQCTILNSNAASWHTLDRLARRVWQVYLRGSGPHLLPPVPMVQVGTIIKMMAMRPSEFVPKKPPGLNGGLPGTMIPSWNAVIRNLDGRLVKPATVRLRSVLLVQMFAQIAPALPQRLMPMWDVKVALVIMPVMEPQVALGIMATQGARIVQAVSGRRLVSILVTTLLQQGRVHFGTSSCLGVIACNGAFGTIGDESCLGERACSGQTGTIGDQSCTKGSATQSERSCDSNKGIIGDGSCTEPGSCFDTADTSKIGNDSW